MAARTKTSAMHSAGIFADMTVDGPDIGTLVVIVDRAKNLPNRKSIGKQDPYCAMRLGKEAKKTETDRRGGQTPRWDQELRFTVHDSADYFQMKVSVFNDDKRTDLIGECWVSLADVVVAGGGQNDLWHNLSCRGKYAGEIRIEITYYDSRPRPEKQADKSRQSTSVRNDAGRSSMGGPRELSTTVKRRPLPADPTGVTPSPPAPVATSEPDTTPARSNHSQTSYVQTQSPLQAVEYNTQPRPTLSYTQQQTSHGSRASNGYGPLPGTNVYAPAPRALQNGRLEIYDPADHDHNSTWTPASGPEFVDHDVRDPNNYQQPYDEQDERYEERQYDHRTAPPSPGGPPPPPPAHRSFHNSPSTYSDQGRPSPHVQSVPSPIRFNTTQLDNHRHSMPTYGSGDRHTSSDLPPSSSQQRPPANGTYVTNQQVVPRHHSYDDHYGSTHDSMQASLQDAPPSPSPGYPQTSSRDFYNSNYDNLRHGLASGPPSFNHSARAAPHADGYVLGTGPASPSCSGYYSNNSPVSSREPSFVGSDLSARTSYTPQSRSNDTYATNGQPPHWHQSSNYGHPSRPQEEGRSAYNPNCYLPPMPASLVSEVDPRIGQELSNRTYSDSQLSYHSDPRDSQQRYNDTASNRYSQPYSRYQQEAAVPFVPAAASHDDRRTRIATGTYSPISKPRAISPDPRVPARKSVSPSPAPSEPRRLSGVPFGPDAYDALNPSVTPTRPVESRHNSVDVAIDADSKIIMHDGREVDPSDHLPQESWAPEPAKRSSKAQAEPQPRTSPLRAQPMQLSGTRPLRAEPHRPQSMGSMQGPGYESRSYSDPPTPAPTTGRNRLQKRASQVPQSSPLSSISSYHDNNSVVRNLARAHTVDLAVENNYAAQYQNSHHLRGNSGSSLHGPPIPAKVPMNYNGVPAQENAWALLEEMKNIDLGSAGGRTRRKGHLVV